METLLIIALWVLAINMAFGALIQIWRVGKPRKPVSAGDAVTGVVFATLYAVVLIAAALTL